MTMHAKTFAAREREAERKWMDERIADMTIPEQAVEAAAKVVFAEGVEHGWWREPKTYDALDPVGKEEFDALISRALTAAQPLMGVQRPEDVARAIEPTAWKLKDTSQDGVVWEVKRSYSLVRAAAVLALPHTGQPQEGLGDCGLETIQTLLDLLNPLLGSIDKQVMEQVTDERELDAPSDREYGVNVTARMERDLTQAVLILEDRKRAAKSRPAPQAGCAKEGWHPKVWSSFDLIEACTKPKWCCGCEFKHPFCEEGGKVIEPAALSAAGQPEVTRD